MNPLSAKLMVGMISRVVTENFFFRFETAAGCVFQPFQNNNGILVCRFDIGEIDDLRFF